MKSVTKWNLRGSICKGRSLANKEGIMKLGAKGVVEIDNQLKIIFGKEARKLKKYIDAKK